MKPKFAVVYDPHFSGRFYLDDDLIYDIPIFAVTRCYELNLSLPSKPYRVVRLDFTVLDDML